MQKLKGMTEFLDRQPHFSVRTQSTLEDMHLSGHRVDFDVAANVTVARPNKMRAMRVGDVMDQRLYYDGKTMTLYNPAQKVYATEKAPPTVETMIDFARETIGILLPAADLLYRNAFPLLMQDVTLRRGGRQVGDRRRDLRPPAVQPPGRRLPGLDRRGPEAVAAASTRSPRPARRRC